MLSDIFLRDPIVQGKEVPVAFEDKSKISICRVLLPDIAEINGIRHLLQMQNGICHPFKYQYTRSKLLDLCNRSSGCLVQIQAQLFQIIRYLHNGRDELILFHSTVPITNQFHLGDLLDQGVHIIDIAGNRLFICIRIEVTIHT